MRRARREEDAREGEGTRTRLRHVRRRLFLGPLIYGPGAITDLSDPHRGERVDRESSGVEGGGRRPSSIRPY